MKTYSIEIAGHIRHLPIVPVTDELSIASFNLLGDVELVSASAIEIASKLPHIDVLVTAEAKGIPLIYELSKILTIPRYVVARKEIKNYMHQPLIHEVHSITTAGKQLLVLDYDDAAFLKDKRVAIIDDVISSGSSLEALESLVTQAGGEIVARAAILIEGDSIDRTDIIHLNTLPLFSLELPKAIEELNEKGTPQKI
ncbi:MAG: adenine phosphoribosyltransferase [Kurthia sp.]|nr:adenine phosphoribosyltransferase [Candidatus Kurthia equi]